MLFSLLTLTALVVLGKASNEIFVGENEGGYFISSELSDQSLVHASVIMNMSGWEYLTISYPGPPTITSERTFSVYRAAGVSEGFLLCDSLVQSYDNFFADNFGEDLPPRELVDFFVSNFLYVDTMSSLHSSDDKFWMSAKSNLEEMKGIIDGFGMSRCSQSNRNSTSNLELSMNWTYNQLIPQRRSGLQSMNLLQLLMMNAWGDLYTISTMIEINNRTLFRDGLSSSESSRFPLSQTHLKPRRIFYPHKEVERDLRCSSLFKILADRSDVLFAHTTWSSFIALGPRVFKHISLPTPVKSASLGEWIFEMRDIHFSSGPGLLASLDDFYIVKSTSARLVVIETTNDILNMSLFSLVKPQSALCWLRAIVSSSIAVDAESWTVAFSRFASGTYTNQWQILDMIGFVPGQPLPPNSFWIAEEVPGTVQGADMTAWLNEYGYWPSYNVPYLPKIRDISGYTAACQKLSPLGNYDYCWESNPRALIYQQRAPKISSVEDLKYLMTYNNWKEDPLSKHDPCNAISCRRDLEPNPLRMYPSGGADCKISSFAQSFYSHEVIVDALVGPTKVDQPVFCWSQLAEEYVHEGQPDCFNFDWTVLSA